MLWLVSGGTKTVRELAPQYPGRLGVLLEPIGGNSVWPAVEMDLPWACNAGALDGFNRVAFERMLERVEGVAGCLWVAAPDMPGKAKPTLTLAEFWTWPIRNRQLPVALVAQDGMETLDIPWFMFDALVVGGTVDWKLSRAATSLVREARNRRKLVHMTQVNSVKRLKHALAIGCNSVDGISASRFGDTFLAGFLGAIAAERSQLRFA